VIHSVFGPGAPMRRAWPGAARRGRGKDSELAVLEKQRRLFVIVTGDEIVVTSHAGFRAAYCRRPHYPQLIVRRLTDTDDHEVIAQAWQTAKAKARELGWIGTPITHFRVKRRGP